MIDMEGEPGLLPRLITKIIVHKTMVSWLWQPEYRHIQLLRNSGSFLKHSVGQQKSSQERSLKNAGNVKHNHCKMQGQKLKTKIQSSRKSNIKYISPSRRLEKK